MKFEEVLKSREAEHIDRHKTYTIGAELQADLARISLGLALFPSQPAGLVSRALS